MKSICVIIALLASIFCQTIGEITSDGCGETKNCYRFPENCDVKTPECRFISWRPSGDNDHKYKFEMSGDVGGGDRYISFALALISDMKDADMYYCDGQTFGTGAFQVRREDPTYIQVGNGITDQMAKTVDGVANCEFTRPASINRVISEGADHDFDVEEHKYFLLVAVGNMSGNLMVQHDWRVHLHDSYDFSFDPASAGNSMFGSYWLSLIAGIWIAVSARNKITDSNL